MRASGWILLLAGATIAVADLEMRQPLVTSAPGLSAIQPVSAVSERPVRYGAVAEVARVAARLEKYGGLQEMPEVGGAIAGLGPAGGISPMSFWRFHALRRPEDSAAWDNELRDLDVPNAFEQPAFPGAKDLKLVAVADWSMPPPSDTNAVRMLQERVLEEKAHGYNGVALGYRTDLGAERVLDMLSWARSHFDTVLLTVVVRPPYAGPADIKSELDALLGSGNVDAVVSGYGSTIDVMGAFVANPHYRDTHRGRSTQYFTRWVDRECHARGVPVFGFVWPNVHGGGLGGFSRRVDYAHAPEGAAGYVLGNVQPRGAWAMVRSAASLKAMIGKLPGGKPVILGPFFREMRGKLNISEAQLERRVESYRSYGYGVIKHL